MIFLALKTEDGRITGKISFYCRMLGVSRQGFYKYLANKDRPWKYQDLADAMKEMYTVNHEYWPIFWPPFPAAWFTAQLFLTCSGRSLVTDLTMEAGLL